jgi:hypothetical protein
MATWSANDSGVCTFQNKRQRRGAAVTGAVMAVMAAELGAASTHDAGGAAGVGAGGGGGATATAGLDRETVEVSGGAPRVRGLREQLEQHLQCTPPPPARTVNGFVPLHALPRHPMPL